MGKLPNFGIYSPKHVKQYGAARAIILGCIVKWCNHNEKINNHLYDGYYWSGHITQEEFAEQTGLDIQAVQRALKWLLDCKVIEKSRYNKVGYDRTGWYRPTGHFVPKPTYQNDRKVPIKMIPTTYQNDSMEHIKMIGTIPVNPFKSIKNPPTNPILGEIDFIELNKEQVDALTPDQRVEYFYNKNEFLKLKKQIK